MAIKSDPVLKEKETGNKCKFANVFSTSQLFSLSKKNALGAF